MVKDKKGENNPRYKTGLAMNGGSGLYHSWQNMKQRCTNPKHPKYKRYGGRGIKICKDWLDITGFMKWAQKNGWKEGLTIDRIDNNGDYCPENCRWVTMADNSRRKRTTKITPEQAENMRNSNENITTLAEKYGCTEGNVWFIINGYTHVPDGECTKKLKKQKKG